MTAVVVRYSGQIIVVQMEEDVANHDQTAIQIITHISMLHLPISCPAIFLALILIPSGYTASHGDVWKLVFVG